MYQYSFANVDLIIEMDYPETQNPKKFKVTGYGAGENLVNIARRAPIATTQFGKQTLTENLLLLFKLSLWITWARTFVT